MKLPPIISSFLFHILFKSMLRYDVCPSLISFNEKSGSCWWENSRIDSSLKMRKKPCHLDRITQRNGCWWFVIWWYRMLWRFCAYLTKKSWNKLSSTRRIQQLCKLIQLSCNENLFKVFPEGVHNHLLLVSRSHPVDCMLNCWFNLRSLNCPLSVLWIINGDWNPPKKFPRSYVYIWRLHFNRWPAVQRFVGEG